MHIDVEAGELCSLLERAVGSPGRVHEPYATVMFTHGVIAAQRVSMWVENTTVVLGSWVGELQPQYRHFYGNSAAVQGLLALAENGWQVRPNLHLAYHQCPPQRRWYPRMAMDAADYAHYWTHDLSSAGRKPRAEIDDPVFAEWLVDNGFVAPTELPGLQDWLAGHARTKIDIRPSMAIEWHWSESHPSLPSVRAAVGEFLAAIREPALP
ncbi:hypothetical protein [Nocardia sp. NPDC058705]|uniref:hypothetical protein n=1 Tax=Nocardia sp. NPDC058705 TaxID=3346609 RepID=UPI0036ACB5FE